MTQRYLPLLLLFTMVATCIEVDMSVPSFPEIAQHFGISSGTMQLTIAYNFLGYCIGAFLYGPLSESYGRRAVMLIGNAVMLLGAWGCVYASSIEWLLLARFIQGVGASTAIVLVFAIIADAYEPPQAMKFIALINAAIGILMAGAPIVGGFINEAIGWRGNYTTVAVISLISWLLQVMFLPETNKNLQPMRLSKHVTNYKTLLFSAPFMSAALIPSLLFAAYMAYIACSAFLYKQTFGLSTIDFVMHQAFIIGTFAIVSILSNKIIAKLGAQSTKTLGLGITGISGAGLLYMGAYYPQAVTMTALLCLFSCGFAACYPVIFQRSLSIFPAMHGTASSVIMGIRALLVTGFTALSAQYYNNEVISVAIPVAIGIFAGIALALLPLRAQAEGA